MFPSGVPRGEADQVKPVLRDFARSHPTSYRYSRQHSHVMDARLFLYWTGCSKRR
jgi:hypothetical protein